jgi:hypothetical protein
LGLQPQSGNAKEIYQKAEKFRSTDIFMDFKRGLITHFVGEQAHGDWVGDIYEAAKGRGVQDFEAGFVNAPQVFMDEPFLLRAWNDGFGLCESLEEMSDCFSCNDGTGNPCPYHG